MLPFRKSNSRVCFLYTLIIAHFFDFINLLFAFFQKNFEQARTAKRGELVRCGTKPRVLVFRTCRKPTGNLPEPNTRHKTLPGFKACSIRGIRDLTACCAKRAGASRRTGGAADAGGPEKPQGFLGTRKKPAPQVWAVRTMKPHFRMKMRQVPRARRDGMRGSGLDRVLRTLLARPPHSFAVVSRARRSSNAQDSPAGSGPASRWDAPRTDRSGA